MDISGAISSRICPIYGAASRSICWPMAIRRSPPIRTDRKSTRLNSSHSQISYAVFCLKKKKSTNTIYLTKLRILLLKLTYIKRHDISSIHNLIYTEKLKISEINARSILPPDQTDLAES